MTIGVALRHALGLAALAAALGPGLARAQDLPANAPEVARRAVHVCASCHDDGGRSKTALVPHLAGQSAQYTVTQLRDFRAQQRAETDSKAYMWGVSALLEDDTIQALAEYYAVQAPAPGKTRGSAAQLKRGRALFERGLPDKQVRPCAQCHGDKAEGAAGFPRLAGQHAAYLEAQLEVFHTRLRPHGVLMKFETAGLSKADKKALALYLQSM